VCQIHIAIAQLAVNPAVCLVASTKSRIDSGTVSTELTNIVTENAKSSRSEGVDSSHILQRILKVRVLVLFDSGIYF
jgi:hypothetical protein